VTAKHAVPVFVSAMAILAIHLSCGGSKSSSKHSISPNAVKAKPGKLKAKDGKTPKGLAIELSDGSSGSSAGGASKVKAARVKSLANGAAQSLLSRLSQIKSKSTDTKKFHLRGKSLPPPRTGRTVKTKFPAVGSGGPPVVKSDKGPLKVLRFAPEGDVPLAPHLSVTFSQPMIAVSSHANTTAKGVPVKLTPQPKGKWRWIGTRTLLFDPDVRFPQATKYKIEIPAGTKSANGGVLKRAKRWTFSTPAPRIKTAYPKHGPHGLTPVMFISFDQKIDPAAVLKEIRVRDRKKTFKIRLATANEIEADKAVARMVKAANKSHHKGRYITFRVDGELPKESSIVVKVLSGTPSKEGPRTTKRDQSYNFTTYAPLRVVRHRCGWSKNCPPGQRWYVRFNNPLDAKGFDPASINIDPQLPRYRSFVSHSNLYIRGSSKARTTYTATLPAQLTDKFGQTLGADKELTFQVGSARPFMRGKRGLTVADPVASKPTYSAFTVNIDKLNVKVWKVSPADWWPYTKYMRNRWRRIKGKYSTPPGRLVVDKTVATGGTADELTETNIDLKPALKGKFGHAIVHIEPTSWPRKRKPELRAWVQVTKIGLDAFVDDRELIGWATKLADGSPLSGVSLKVSPSGNSSSSDGKGMTNIALGKRPNKKATKYDSTVQMLIARKGNDVAFLPEHSHVWSDHGSWYETKRKEQLRWFVFDDRKMYKPGEHINFKGWMRRIDFGEGGDTNALRGAVDRVTFQVKGAQGNTLGKGTATVNAAGGFHAKFKLPKNANLGYAYIRFNAAGGTGGVGNTGHSHSFRIQEFRRPEYEVTVKAGQGPYMVGSGTDVTVKAKYYAGGGLANADVRWYVSANTGTFRPPNRDKFVFGEWVPWWRHRGNTNHTSYHKRAKTDAAGNHVLHMDFVSVNPPRPMTVQVRGSVTDVNRQSWTGRATMLVHPSSYYIGLKNERMFVEKGEPLEVKAIVVDHDGKAIVGRKVSMQAVRMEWTYENGEYKNKEKDPQDCSLTSAAKAKVCAFPTKEGGIYYITATVSDDKGRANETKVTAWVSGGKVVPQRNVSKQKVELIPSKKEYKVGDTAELLVRAPFFPAEALMTIRRSGIVSTKRFKMKTATTTLKVPIREAYLPNVFVHVDLVGAAARTNDKGKADPTLPKRPAFASGAIKLSIPPVGRKLNVEVTPAVKKLAPGGKTHLSIRVRDAAGEPVPGAEVAVVVVDESVLSLTGYRLPKALAAFYPQRGINSRDAHMRSMVTLANPDSTKTQTATGKSTGAEEEDDKDGNAEKKPGDSAPPPPSVARNRRTKNSPKKAKAGRGGGGANQAPIAVRIDFSALALFSPEVATDGNGKARVAIKLPDNLTRYRIMAVAVDTGRRFGNGESSVTARKPLMVRPSAPRFLNFGDRFELPVVLQNQTDAAMQVRVAARATNATFTKSMGYSLTVPANDRVEVRFPAAAQMPGTARFQIAASSGSFADAAEFSLPVWTPATTEAFATYGVISRGAMRQPVAMPKNVVKEFGGLEITTSSTQLQALTDAMLYLVNYPFECTEQMSSRVLAVSSLRDVLTAFKAKGLPSSDKIEASVRRDIKMLSRLQNYNGGFAFWRRGDRSWPYISIFVAHALTTAKKKGYKVPARTLNRSKSYLRDIKRHIPGWYPLRVKQTLRAYALRVRALMKDVDIAKAKALIREATLRKLAMEAVGWLYTVLSGDKTSTGQIRAIRRHLANRVSETAAAANYTTSYSDGAHLLLHSSRRADGIILEAMIKDQPKSKLIPKLVRGLLAHRKRGRWTNTQENSFVLLAMDRYFNKYEKVTPNFVAKIWLGQQFAGEHTYKGRSTDRKHIDVPMSYLAKVKNADLVMAKKGKGRLYYRVGMTYAPTSLKLGPTDHGFAVDRVYEAVDKPGDVTRRADGVWVIKAGARVRVRLTMVAVNRRYHVALVDKLPAGLETLNPALAVTGPVPQDPKTKKRGRYWWWNRTWYEHQNMRDERTEAFTSLLWQGVHNYTYVTRATTPGNFVVPPAKAEEMYHPETFGRSASDRVIIR